MAEPKLVRRAEMASFPPSLPLDKAGGGGDDGGMEPRIAALEAANLETRDRLARIETRLDSVATKADLIEVYKSIDGVHKTISEVHKTISEVYKAINAQTWKVIGCAAGLVTATWFIARYIH